MASPQQPRPPDESLPVFRSGSYNPRPSPPLLAVRSSSDAGGANEPLVPSASSLSTALTLCNTAIGAGVLGIPYAFACAGLVGTLLLFAAVAISEGFSLYVLAKFAERYDAPSYGVLVRRALGRRPSAALSCLMVLYLWGASVAYLVVVADAVSGLSVLHLGTAAWTSQRGLVMPVIGVLVLLPLCLPQHLSALEAVSGFAVVCYAFTAAAVSLRGLQVAATRPGGLWSGVAAFGGGSRALQAVSLLVFGLNCHANVVGVFWELSHDAHRIIPVLPSSPSGYAALGRLAPRPVTRRLIGMLGAILLFLAIMVASYTAVGVTGYMAYGAEVSSNVLSSLPQADWLMQAARACVGLVCLASFPLNHHPARLAVEDVCSALVRVPLPRLASVVFTAMFVGTTLATACVVDDLGSVLRIVGGTVAAALVYVMPGILLVNAAIIKHVTSTRGPSSAGGGLAAPLLPDQDDDGSGSSSSGVVAAVAQRSAPSWPVQQQQLSKTAGLREEGLAWAPGKSWLAGLGLIVVGFGVVVLTIASSM